MIGVRNASCNISTMRIVSSLLLLLLAVAIGANEPIPMTVPELTQKADLIVRGKVESKSVRRDAAGRIFTEVKLLTLEVWKGDPKKPLLTVVHGGGILGDQKVTALGQVNYEPGEEIIGFFVWNERGEAVTLSMSQGKFNVSGSAASNPFHKDVKLQEFKQRVHEARK